MRAVPGPGHGVEFEMLAGMAPGQQAVVRESTGTMRLYVPIVHPRHFDVAVSYLVRRLEENASSQNFLSAAFELESSEELFERERQRFVRALERAMSETSLPTHRDQDRGAEAASGGPLRLGSPALPAVPGAFRNTPDTDLSMRRTRSTIGSAAPSWCAIRRRDWKSRRSATISRAWTTWPARRGEARRSCAARPRRRTAER